MRTRCPTCSLPPGYGSTWRTIAAAAIAASPICADCAHTGSAANPLTADHVVPRAQGGRDEATNTRVLCRVCNGRRGGRTRAPRADRR